MFRGTTLELIVILSFTTVLEAEKYGVYFQIEENAFTSDKTIISSGKAVSLLSCSLMCVRREDCRSANFIQADGGTCLFYSETVLTKHPERLLPQKGSFFLEKVCIKSQARLKQGKSDWHLDLSC